VNGQRPRRVSTIGRTRGRELSRPECQAYAGVWLNRRRLVIAMPNVVRADDAFGLDCCIGDLRFDQNNTFDRDQIKEPWAH